MGPFEGAPLLFLICFRPQALTFASIPVAGGNIDFADGLKTSGDQIPSGLDENVAASAILEDVGDPVSAIEGTVCQAGPDLIAWGPGHFDPFDQAPAGIEPLQVKIVISVLLGAVD